MANLRKAKVFLSASFPSGKRGKEFMPYDASGIADAVSALVRGVLGGNGRILFGGHPTITPLVFMVARELRVQNSVIVYQSSWFREEQIPEIDEISKEKLGRIVWTDQRHTREASLETMRDTMTQLASQWVAALFVGGMDGIRDEYDKVKKRSPKTPCIPITGPGGAAARLPGEDCGALGLSQVYKSRAYPLLAVRFVDAIAERIENRGDGR